MAKLDTALRELGALDLLAARDTPLTRLDPRAKVLTTLAFILVVVSYGRYDIGALLPLLLYPVALLALGELPLGFLGRKLLIAAPFAVCVGLFNPLFDRTPLLLAPGLTVAGGWVSFASILLRFLLTVSAALLLIAGTGFHTVCMAFNRFGMPRVFTAQLLFLYRYVFVLIDEARRMHRARELRSVGRRGQGLRVYGALLGQLLLRTLDRAQRIHLAMICRGFDGEIRVRRPGRFGGRDLAFVLGWLAFFALARTVHLPRLIGALLTGGLS